jgi:hypothetical protein
VNRGLIETSATERARWLTEVAEALEQAQKLAWHMGLLEHKRIAAMELYGRLEAARLEVQALRFGQFAAAQREYGPEWSELTPWTRDAAPERR